jgi:APA family basic amino acid/polyamine antiporter
MFVANYAVTFTTFLVVRKRQPDAPKPFRVPLDPLVPGLALLGSLAFIGTALASDTTHSLLAAALVGLSWLIYRLFRRKAIEGGQRRTEPPEAFARPRRRPQASAGRPRLSSS